MKGNLMKSCVCVAICLYFTSIATASSAVFSNLIVFGDSLSDAASLSTEPNMAKEKDVGNNYWVKTQGKTGAPVTSEDPTSKTSPIWPNDLMANTSASLIEANPDRSRYIYPARQAGLQGLSPLRFSINYAWASAETGEHYVNDLNPAYTYNDRVCQGHGPGFVSAERACVPGVLLQVKQYLSDVQHRPNDHTLFIIWAGGNDFFNNMSKIVVENKQNSKPELLLKMLNAPFPMMPGVGGKFPLSNAIKNLQQAVEMLIQAGVPAQNIYVINLPNLANTPAAQSFINGSKTMYYLLAAMTDGYNMMLRIMLAFNYFHSQFNLPNGNIISADAEFSNILKNYQQLGFSKLLQNCVQDGAAPYCQGYIFFNGKHPTTEAHKLLANYLQAILSERQTAGVSSASTLRNFI